MNPIHCQKLLLGRYSAARWFGNQHRPALRTDAHEHLDRQSPRGHGGYHEGLGPGHPIEVISYRHS